VQRSTALITAAFALDTIAMEEVLESGLRRRAVVETPSEPRLAT
jgi:hypothetical protein